MSCHSRQRKVGLYVVLWRLHRQTLQGAKDVVPAGFSLAAKLPVSSLGQVPDSVDSGPEKGRDINEREFDEYRTGDHEGPWRVVVRPPRAVAV